MIKKETKIDFGQLKIPFTLLVVFWAIAIALWQLWGDVFWLFNFGYIGTFLLGKIDGWFFFNPKITVLNGYKFTYSFVKVFWKFFNWDYRISIQN